MRRWGRAVKAIRIGRAAFDHVSAYADLVLEAVSEWRSGFARRAAYVIVGSLLATGAIVTASGWLLLAVWDLPQRGWILTLVILLLAGGAVMAFRTAQVRTTGPRQLQLKAEWQRDRALLGELSRDTTV